MPYRHDRIEQLLAATPRHTMASMQSIQADQRSAATLVLLPSLQAALQTPATPLASAARDAMAGCDGVMRADSAAPLTQSAAALTRALARLQTSYGGDVRQWSWGRAHPALSSHKPFGNVPQLARFFDVRTPTGGDTFTVNVGQYWPNDEKAPFANRHAASMRALDDLADLEKSQFTYQTGQSGLVFCSRYRDMQQAWGQVAYRPLQLQPAAMAHQLTLVP